MVKKGKDIYSILGWIGVGCVASAYTLLIFGVFNYHDVLYLFLNIVGSWAILIEAWKVKNYQPVVLNMFWALVAFISLISVLF